MLKKILILLNWNENWMELEHEQLVKGVNKCELEKKKILLVERLIVLKREDIHLSEYMTDNGKSKNFGALGT